MSTSETICKLVQFFPLLLKLKYFCFKSPCNYLTSKPKHWRLVRNKINKKKSNKQFFKRAKFSTRRVPTSARQIWWKCSKNKHQWAWHLVKRSRDVHFQTKYNTHCFLIDFKAGLLLLLTFIISNLKQANLLKT